MLGISETTFKDSGRGLRSMHAKSHGLLTGSLRVLNDLPAVLAQGIAGSPRTYPVVIRLSTRPGDIPDDEAATARWLDRILAAWLSRLLEVALRLVGAQLVDRHRPSSGASRTRNASAKHMLRMTGAPPR